MKSIYRAVKMKICRSLPGESGTSAVELALILPLMLMILCALIDFGRLIQARLVLTNVAREGASLGFRDIQSATSLISMLKSAATPLDLGTSGKIYIWKIRAGTTKNSPNPTIDLDASKNGGSLSVPSSIGMNEPTLGLTPSLYNHLVFDENKNTSDISDVTVVEVFYKYQPITPVSLVPGITESGLIISSKSEL